MDLSRELASREKCLAIGCACPKFVSAMGLPVRTPGHLLQPPLKDLRWIGAPHTL